jgi:hypothetical protein
MQGMATEQSRQCAQKATGCTVSLDGFSGVLGTRRRETTRSRQPGRNDDFVGAERFQRNGSANAHAHFSPPKRASRSTRTSAKRRLITDCFGFTTKSKPFGINARDVLRISLTFLLIRFLSCAFPNFREVVSPKRLYFFPFFNLNNTKNREVRFEPSSYTLLNSCAVLSRTSFGKMCVSTSATIHRSSNASPRRACVPYLSWP